MENTKNHTIIEYILIIALYYVTGGAFSYTHYNLQIILFFICTFIGCIILNKHHFLSLRRVFVPWMLMNFFVMLVPCLHVDSIPTYIAIVMQLSIGLFCASIIPPEHFKDKYVRVMVFFAAVSLIGFAIGNIAPGFAYRFPLTIGDASVDYYNAGIYVFMRPKGYAENVVVLTERNAGICWEPGCYQMFLNVALFFLLNRERTEHQKYFYLSFFILIITIMSTVSTTGIILMVLLLTVFFRSWSRGMKWGWLLAPVMIAAMIWLYTGTDVAENFQLKLNREFGENLTALERISIDKIWYLFPEHEFPQLLGMSFAKWLTYNEKMWNSIIHSFLCLGVPFTLIHLLGYFKGSRVLANKRAIVLFLVMILSASTETLFWRVFFNTIAFYGWIYDQSAQS